MDGTGHSPRGLWCIYQAARFVWFGFPFGLRCLPALGSRSHDSLSTKRNNKAPAPTAAMQPFQAVFAVPMTCEGCAKDILASLHQLIGIVKADANVEEQLVTVEGTASPSAVVEAIQKTGRDAILRGSGESNHAAVSILETYHHHHHSYRNADNPEAAQVGDGGAGREVRGLARLVQVSPTLTLVDLSLQGLASGTYHITVREFGDVKHGVLSTGPVWTGAGPCKGANPDDMDKRARGDLGTLQIGGSGRGSAFLEREFQVWEVIGHAMIVTRQGVGVNHGARVQNDPNTIVGVVARSAGMWDNDKKVCSCTGKTLWDERKDLVKKGML